MFEGDPFVLVPPNFVMFDLFFIFAYPENFMYIGCVVKKFELRWPRLRKNPHFGTPKLFQTLSFIIAYQRWSPQGRPWPRGRPRGHIFEVLGLGLEASIPQKLPCPRLEDSTIF